MGRKGGIIEAIAGLDHVADGRRGACLSERREKKTNEVASKSLISRVEAQGGRVQDWTEGSDYLCSLQDTMRTSCHK